MVFDEKARHGFELELHPTRQLTSVLNECRGGCCPPGVIVIKPFSPLFLMVLRTKGLEHFFLARPGLIFEGKFRSLPSGNHLAKIKTSLEKICL